MLVFAIDRSQEWAEVAIETTRGLEPGQACEFEFHKKDISPAALNRVEEYLDGGAIVLIASTDLSISHPPVQIVRAAILQSYSCFQRSQDDTYLRVELNICGASLSSSSMDEEDDSLFWPLLAIDDLNYYLVGEM